MNTEGSNQETGLTMNEAAASIASQLFREDNQQQGDDNAVKATSQEAEEVEATEAEDGEEEAESQQVEATESEEAEQDSEGETEEADDDQDEPRYTVKVDGKDEEVTLSELQAGYSRQSSFTRKSQALAEERKTFQAEADAVRQERAQYAHLLGVLEQQVKAAAPEDIDWNKRFDDDPLGAPKEYAQWQQNQARLAAIQAEQQRVQQAEQAEQQKRFEAYIAEQAQKLVEAVPTWTDATKAKAEQDAIRDHAMGKFGFTSDELKGIVDHRVAVVLRKAWQFDQLMAKSKATKPVVPKAKTVPPGSAQPPRKATDLTRSKQRLAKTGTVSDAAGVIRQLLG